MIEIYNDDCRNLLKELIEKHNQKVILVSDPPFNIGYKYNS